MSVFGTPRPSDDALPVAVWSGEVRLGDMTVRMHVLDDGRRIIEQADYEALIDWMWNAADASDVQTVRAIATLIQDRGVPADAQSAEAP